MALNGFRAPFNLAAVSRACTHSSGSSHDPRIEELANRFRAWGPAVAWAALLFFLSALPDLPGPSCIPFGDKLGHFVLYGVFGVLLAWGRSRWPRRVGHLLLLGIGAAYGISDEWHQMYVPGRTPDVVDWLADVTGLVTGYAIAATFLNRSNAHESEEPVR